MSTKQNSKIILIQIKNYYKMNVNEVKETFNRSLCKDKQPNRWLLNISTLPYQKTIQVSNILPIYQ